MKLKLILVAMTLTFVTTIHASTCTALQEYMVLMKVAQQTLTGLYESVGGDKGEVVEDIEAVMEPMCERLEKAVEEITGSSSRGTVFDKTVTTCGVLANVDYVEDLDEATGEFVMALITAETTIKHM